MIIAVTVKPNSGKSQVDVAKDGSLIVRLKSAPVDGKANEELVKVLAKHFGVIQRAIVIKNGANGRKKIVEILGE